MSEYQPNMSKRMQEFSGQMQDRLNNVGFGEQEAALALTVGLASGSDIVLAGPPGGSKTELVRAMTESIDGLGLGQQYSGRGSKIDGLALIPTQSDLSPSTLIGSTMRTTKTTERDGATELEIVEYDKDAIITPDTAIIFGDEINRVNPMVVNALLPILSGRELVTDNGRVALPNLLNGVFTMNPGERAQATFALPAAFIGRLGVGAFIGASRLKDDEERARVISAIAQRSGSPSYVNAPKIASVHDIKAMQKHVDSVILPSNGAVEDYLVKNVLAITDGLREMGVTDEADGRAAVQLVRNTRTIAALNGRETVEPVDVLTGAKMLVSARIAAQSRDAYQQIPEMHRTLENL